jgi:steroid delta-isomerase-like uncharacterized protein
VDPQSEESKKLMWRITDEIWNQGHPEMMDELIAEDLVDHVEFPGLESTGRSRYRASFDLMRAAFPDFQNPVEFVVADGALAVSYGRATGTHTEAFMGIPPTGRSFDVPMVGILRFEGGRAVERWGVSDNAAMMQQLGLSS